MNKRELHFRIQQEIRNLEEKYQKALKELLILNLEDKYDEKEIINGINELINKNIIINDKEYLRSCY